MNTHWLSVAVVTIANGGDNIGVYTPLFASLDTALILSYFARFVYPEQFYAMGILHVKTSEYSH